MDQGDSFSRSLREAGAAARVMRRVLDEAMILVPGAEGGAIELTRGDFLVYACGAGFLTSHVGTTVGMEGSLSGLSIARGETLRSDHAATDRRVDAALCRRLGVASMICVPLQRGEARVGVLKVASSRPYAFTAGDVEVLSRLAEFVSWAVATASDLEAILDELAGEAVGAGPGPPSADKDDSKPGNSDPAAFAAFVANVLEPGLSSRAAMRERVASVIERDLMTVVCQPILELRSGRIVGVEALARFPVEPRRTPDIWFKEAHQVGRGVELELVAVRKALSLLERIPAGAYLAINASAETAARLATGSALDGADRTRIVVEVTEHLEAGEYPALAGTLVQLRRAGVRIAVDDTGSGYATFAHLLRLAPDIIKLDRVLISGIDLDPVRRALAGALATFGAETGAAVVAEGIENEEELRALKELGIAYGQGYHLGRPGPVSAITNGTCTADS